MRGTELKAYCQKKLADAKLKVEKVLKSQDGNLSLTSLDAE